MRWILSLILLILFVSSCQTAPPAPEPLPPAAAPPISVRKPGPGARTSSGRALPAVDMPLLQRRLGLDRNLRELGFEEKRFDPCREGLTESPDCAPLFFTVIHFRLQCRETEGTVQEVGPIHNIATDQLTFTLGKNAGLIRTDFEGYGQALAVSSVSQKRERFRLTLDNRFLILTAEHVSRIVAPKPWCR